MGSGFSLFLAGDESRSTPAQNRTAREVAAKEKAALLVAADTLFDGAAVNLRLLRYGLTFSRCIA